MSAAGAVAVARCRSSAPEDLASYIRRRTTPSRCPPTWCFAVAATALFRWRYWRGLRRPPLVELSPLAPGRLLDVGSGRGDLGLVLGEHGWRVTGVEPSREACDEANARGAPTLHGTLATVSTRLDSDFEASSSSTRSSTSRNRSMTCVWPGSIFRPGAYCSSRSLISVAGNRDASGRTGSTWICRATALTSRRAASISFCGRAGLEPLRRGTSTSADGLPMSIQYRLFGERRCRRGFPLYASITATLATSPLTALADRAAGAGDILHAVARRAHTPAGHSAPPPG